MKALAAIFPVFAIFMAASLPGNAQSTSQKITAECTTKATGMDGKRHGCSSKWSIITAPTGFVFAKDTFKGGKVSKSGSEHSCQTVWEGDREVVPGVKQPTVLKIRAKARSPKGYNSGRGWVNCEFSVQLVRLPNS